MFCMAKGVMVNFRLRDEDVVRIDQAASTLGLSRSDFIRRAVSEFLQDVAGGSEVGVVGKRGKAKEKASTLDGNCPRNSYCVFVKDSDRSRVCRTCGYRKS